MRQSCGFDVTGYLKERAELINRWLDRYLPPEDKHPADLHRAMRYSVFSGGKRFRPVLCMAAFEGCGGVGEHIMPVACAIELVHTYSLIHDDLPCMDNDDLRRGKPTCHRVFGEDVAILAGDALLTFAIELIVTRGATLFGEKCAVAVARDLLESIGTEGMVAGQVMDMKAQGKKVDASTIEYIHKHKTGALITSAVRCGAIVGGAHDDVITRLTNYGRNLGLAFQIVDDILDVEGSFGNLKSGGGLDKERGKATYPAVFGLGRSRQIARELVEEAKNSIEPLGESFLPLTHLAEFVIGRTS